MKNLFLLAIGLFLAGTISAQSKELKSFEKFLKGQTTKGILKIDAVCNIDTQYVERDGELWEEFVVNHRTMEKAQPFNPIDAGGTISATFIVDVVNFMGKNEGVESLTIEFEQGDSGFQITSISNQNSTAYRKVQNCWMK